MPSETFAVCPGFSAIDEDERFVDHPAGSVDARLTVLAAHPEESLLVTETEYPAVWPGYMLGFSGATFKLGAEATHEDVLP